MKKTLLNLIIALLALIPTFALAAEVVEVTVIDKDYILIHIKDGEVTFVDDGVGAYANRGHHLEPSNSIFTPYGQAFNVQLAQNTDHWIISSATHQAYSGSGRAPSAVHRKSKLNGLGISGWDSGANDWDYDFSKEHYVYLKMPESMEQGASYTLYVSSDLNVSVDSLTFTFDIFQSVSEAIHVNLIGHLPESRKKAADLYVFLGDGGYRDYSEFEGNSVFLYDVNTEQTYEVGTVSFWKQSARETQWNLTGSDVWKADFSGFSTPGTYRLVVEGIGASQDFEIAEKVYEHPFKVSLLGYYYMRIGEDALATPTPRQPRFIPQVDPVNSRVYITSMHPYHSQWSTFASGDAWDQPDKWSSYVLTGSPQNNQAYGGHSDALDWDRHLGHVSSIYDLLMGYILSNGKLDDDDIGIAESGNGIPDVIDEARNEVDFWLRLRYKKGYSHGLTNPNNGNILYQAGNTTVAAWANALNSAMLAFSYQIAGEDSLKEIYTDSAMVAFEFAQNAADPMLNRIQDVGQAKVRGKDFKMMAAAYLYNITGNTDYEDIMNAESVVNGPIAPLFVENAHHQLWGALGYLFTPRAVNYPTMFSHMKSSIIHHAKAKEANLVKERPSRRGHSNDGTTAWFQTVQDMPRTLIAHAITDNPTEKVQFLDALLLEAGWGLGRNPLNMIQMTTATTPLAQFRSVENCYTSGRDDGSVGMHPGHTPYLNMEDWGGHMLIGRPSGLTEHNYPAWNEWPHAEGYFNVRYMYAHSEFTPQQTMRFKPALYGYLYTLSAGDIAQDVFFADAGSNRTIFDLDADGKEIVRLDASDSFSSSTIDNYEWFAADTLLTTGRFAEVVLPLGAHLLELVVTDDSENQETATVTIEVKEVVSSLLNNGDFSSGMSNWNHYIHTGAAATFAVTDGQIKANITSPGTENWHIQFNQTDLTVNNGWTYQLNFDAYAETERSLDVEVGMQGNPYTTFLDSLIQLSTERSSYRIEFMMEEPTHSESRVNFNLGLSVSDVFLDNISLSVIGTNVSIEEENQSSEIPEKTALFANYPNPFNPSTNIRYQVSEPGHISINVYNVLGQKVTELVQAPHSNGTYAVRFDASHLSSGVYLYQMVSSQGVETRKMLLIK